MAYKKYLYSITVLIADCNGKTTVYTTDVPVYTAGQVMRWAVVKLRAHNPAAQMALTVDSAYWRQRVARCASGLIPLTLRYWDSALSQSGHVTMHVTAVHSPLTGYGSPRAPSRKCVYASRVRIMHNAAAPNASYADFSRCVADTDPGTMLADIPVERHATAAALLVSAQQAVTEYLGYSPTWDRDGAKAVRAVRDTKDGSCMALTWAEARQQVAWVYIYRVLTNEAKSSVQPPHGDE